MVDTQLEYQVDIISAQNINSPKYLIVARQTAHCIGIPNKTINIWVFDNLDVRKFHVDIDDVRYSRDGVNFEYGLNDYVDHYRDLKFFYKEYVGDKNISPFLNYTDMTSKYHIQIIDLRFQVDHINPKLIQPRQE